jgi:hypothetical protein
MDISRFLITLGLAILVIGLLWPVLGKIGLGRLPGDIAIRRDNFSFLFPDRDVPAGQRGAQRAAPAAEPPIEPGLPRSR